MSSNHQGTLTVCYSNVADPGSYGGVGIAGGEGGGGGETCLKRSLEGRRDPQEWRGVGAGGYLLIKCDILASVNYLVAGII